MLHRMHTIKRIDALNKDDNNKILSYVKQDMSICEEVTVTKDTYNIDERQKWGIFA